MDIIRYPYYVACDMFNNVIYNAYVVMALTLHVVTWLQPVYAYVGLLLLDLCTIPP